MGGGSSGEQSPAVPGSYSVRPSASRASTAARTRDRSRSPGRDGDKDGLPDEWQKQYGDPRSDNDGDGLTAACELKLGTDPNTADTDGGGESDGSEVDNATCLAITDPTDPADDRVRGLGSLTVHREARKGVPRLELSWPTPNKATVTIQRRGAIGTAWETIAEEVSGSAYTDHGVVPESEYQYRVIPTTDDGRTGAPQDSTR